MSEYEEIAGFRPQYWAPFRKPRNKKEARRLYNHVRTVAYFLDAAPAIVELPILDQYFANHSWLRFAAKNVTRLPGLGLDALVGFVLPIVGDIIGLIFGLYQLFLSWLFGLPNETLLWMLFNIIVDAVVGSIPIIGDIIDMLFTSNLRNLEILEKHLLSNSEFSIAIPPAGSFRPTKVKKGMFSNVLGTGKSSQDDRSKYKRKKQR